MTIEKQIIGVQFSGLRNETFYSCNPSTNESNDYLFYKSTSQEISLAAEATIAFKHYKAKSGVDKATFLGTIAEEILNIGADLVTVCMTKTALPIARIEGEKGRTINQLKMFATLLREGSWGDARIDTALSDRLPLPGPDLRPVCYQNMPQSLLPAELKNKNILSVFRLVNGERTNKDII
jgi:2,5-dioxopentanoate dehydrogenase